ncbi:MAG: manganese-dependent inorganic pyrophosphatase [Rhodobacteraceae bacterium]|nr:manganese-dependent inorganic pyrophosphatase [Paracoccaceae bacterium]
MIKVFGHKAPDTDATGSAIIWSWYLNEVRGQQAAPFVQDEPNAEAKFVLDCWNLDCPALLGRIEAGDDVGIVDTNNPAELPDGINSANIVAVMDHHLIAGGLQTSQPIEFIVRPVAATATVIAGVMGDALAEAPGSIKGVMLSCIISDTLEFRSPTTTNEDRELALRLATELGVGISDHAAELFAAKSDVSHLSASELLRLDSKIYDTPKGKFRITVLETTSPSGILERKNELIGSMASVSSEDEVEEILVFVIDILGEEATLLIPNDRVRSIVESAFGVTSESDTVVFPGIVSRKKQIVPALRA